MAGRAQKQGGAGSAALGERACELSRELSRAVARLRFAGPVRFVYNPLVYARRPHELYLRRYAATRKRVESQGFTHQLASGYRALLEGAASAAP